MQNLFLSPGLGAAADSPANMAKDVLLQSTIPAARRAGISVVWLNWGLTGEDVKTMPSSIVKAFAMKSEQGESTDHDKDSASEGYDNTGSVSRPAKGLGLDIGPIDLGDGKIVDGGKLLMRDTWNTGLPPDLDRCYREGLQSASKPDIWLHKTRISGFWAGNQQNIDVLKEAGINTLLFAGTKTDVCVLSSLLDAWNVGFDVVLLKDACGTTSPDCTKQAVEFNCERIWGFVCCSADLEKGVDEMLGSSN